MITANGDQATVLGENYLTFSEVFAVRRVFWADLLRFFMTPNGSNRAKFSDQILLRSDQNGQICSDLTRLKSDQILSRVWAESEQIESPKLSINLCKKSDRAWFEPLNWQIVHSNISTTPNSHF